MSKQEEHLYPHIKDWFQEYLESRYTDCKIRTTYKSSHLNLESILRQFRIDPTLAIGLNIKIDILGIISKDNKHEFAFIEVKDNDLTLKDLGQLWGYSQLMEPVESFLISSKGFGALSKLFNVLKREDLLRFGQAQTKYMKIAKWDAKRRSIDFATIIPKL